MSQYPEIIDPTKLNEALETDADDRDDQDWHLIEMAAERWLEGERLFVKDNEKQRSFWGDDPSGYCNGDLP